MPRKGYHRRDRGYFDIKTPRDPAARRSLFTVVNLKLQRRVRQAQADLDAAVPGVKDMVLLPDLACLGKMPAAFSPVLTGAIQGIRDNDPSTGLFQHYLASMNDRARTPAIPVVTATELILLSSRFPNFAVRSCLVKPKEVATDLGLILTVDRDGIVRGGTTKIIAPLFLRMIGICAWINQNLAPTNGQRERQRIGVPSRSYGQVAERPRVGNHAQLARRLELASQYVIPPPAKFPAHRQLGDIPLNVGGCLAGT